MRRKLYLDYAATPPVDPEVMEAMAPFFSEIFGNPSSLHSAGQAARQAVDTARRTIANILGASPREIIFTSGGTESDNLALFGLPGPGPLIVSAIEHEAVLEPAKVLAKRGIPVTFLPVDRSGLIRLDALKKALTRDTTLVSLMLANNEVGTIQPVADAVQLIKQIAPKARVHTDACQAAGILDLNVDRLGIDLLTLSGSKIYGPKGTGLLYVREGLKLTPQMYGGGQENSRRSGTLNVPGIIGLAIILSAYAIASFVIDQLVGATTGVEQ